MADFLHDSLAEELEFLRAMWPSEDELVINRSTQDGEAPANLKAHLVPNTAGQESASLVCCELFIKVPPKYPCDSLQLSLGASRGLADSLREGLIVSLEERAVELEGEPALYAILEAGREALTALNDAPVGECAICLGCLEEPALAVQTSVLRDHSEQPEVIAVTLRTPCYHAFHCSCFADYWESRSGGGQCAKCPECRAGVAWSDVPQLHAFARLKVNGGGDTSEGMEVDSSGHECEESERMSPTLKGIESAMNSAKLDASKWSDLQLRRAVVSPTSEDREEAFVRLHHLWQGNDEKEKPLLRLLKEFGLSATVFYGKPAMLHIQGDAKDVDAFAGVAKRRHITVTIQVSQRSRGPAMPEGITPIPAKKGSLDGEAFRTHLAARGLGESAYSVVGG